MLRFLTAGESHGPALMGILEGLPAGLELSREDIVEELLRRKKGFGRGKRQKIEKEQVQILTGVRLGLTLGSPIGLYLPNDDFKNWHEVMDPEPLPPGGDTDREAKIKQKKVEVPRPGHADLVGALKYGHHDLRNVLERASARETAMRVALGAVAKKFLKELNIGIFSQVQSIGAIEDTSRPWRESHFCEDPSQRAEWMAALEESELRVRDPLLEEKMKDQIRLAMKQGDTLGGHFSVFAFGLPPGLGSYVQWDRRLEGRLARAFMSLNAIKAVEIGDGVELGKSFGSEAHDEIKLSENKKSLTYYTNRAGGITGGMSTGLPLVVQAHMKPISTLMKPLRSANFESLTETTAHVERSDYCAVPSAAVCGEALLALCVAKEILVKYGGDSMEEIKHSVERSRSAYS